MPVLGELELGWRLLAARVHRGDRDQRQDDDGPAARPYPPRRGDRRRGRRQRRDGADGPRGADPAPDAIVVCEASSFQLEDTLAFAPEGAVLLNVAARPPRSPRDVRGLPRREAAGLRPAGQRRRRGRAGRARSRGPRRLRAARAVRAGGELDDRAGCCGGTTSRSSRMTRSGCAGRTTAPTPRRPRRSRWLAGSTRCRADGAADVRGRRAPLGGGRDADGVLYVNDSKATNVASTLVALASFGARRCTSSSAASARTRTSAAARPRRPRVYLIGESAAQSNARSAASAAAISRRRWRGHGRRRCRATSSCCRRPARASTVRRLRGARRAFKALSMQRTCRATRSR